MQKRDVAEIGLKVLGVYFAVYGLVSALTTLTALPYQIAQASSTGRLSNILSFPLMLDGPIRAAALLASAYVLLQHTATCLRWTWGNLLDDA